MTKLEYYSSIVAMQSAAQLARHLPWRALQLLGKSLGQFAYFLSAKHRRITLNNLNLAFGDTKTHRELQGIAFETYGNAGKGLCEALGAIQFSPRKLKRLIGLKGKEHLETALDSGKGIMGFSAHLGNFALIGARLAVEGYPFNIILQEPEIEAVSRVFHSCLKHYGIGVIPASPRNKVAAESLKCLRQNKILCILGDQRELKRGVIVDFFNHPAATPRGPVVLAMRTETDIVPMFSLREPGDKLTVVIEPPFKLVLSGNSEEDVSLNTARLSKIVESYVRRFPAQWFWFHQRWKLT